MNRNQITDTARWERLYGSSNAEGAVNHTASEPHLIGHYHSGSWYINIAIIWINIVVAMKISYFSTRDCFVFQSAEMHWRNRWRKWQMIVSMGN